MPGYVDKLFSGLQVKVALGVVTKLNPGTLKVANDAWIRKIFDHKLCCPLFATPDGLYVEYSVTLKIF